MKKLTAIILASLLFSSSALAWGDREQGALLGFALGAFTANAQQRNSPPVYFPQQQQPICGYNINCREYRQEVYVPVCHIETVVDQFSRVIRSTQVCR